MARLTRLRRGYGGRVDLRYRCVLGIAKRTFQHTSGAKTFRRVGKNPGAALSANSDYPDHRRRVLGTPRLYSVKFCHALRFQHRDKMAEFVFDVAGCRDGVGNLLSQQRLVTLAKSVKRLPDRILSHPQARGDLCL